MELPQPRPYGTAGRKPTLDFLSLYSHSTVQQDPRPPSQGGFPKTQNFLQPLEGRGEKSSGKEETTGETWTVERPPPPAPPPSVEHILPGGIGTYSISHISYFNPRVPKPEGTVFTAAQDSSNERNDDNSNCTSYTGSGGFTLWEESAPKKGKTGKEKAGETPIVREAAAKIGQWSCLDRPSRSSPNNHHHCSSFGALSSSQPSGQKSQSFMEMLKSTKGSSTQEEDMDDDEEFLLKNEISVTHKGELTVKVEGKGTDQKVNTPRSKHSATEQRRRSKINDRFQTLRELIPHSEQKRDKASFLLEVIEYIQFLQEKVHKYEGSYQGWNHDVAKVMPLRNNHRPAESYVDQPQCVSGGSGPALVFAAKFEEKNIPISPVIPGSAQNPVESDLSTTTNFKGMDQYPGISNKAVAFPVSLQSNIFTAVRSGSAVAQLPTRLMSDAEKMDSHPQPQLCQTRSCTTEGAVASDKLKEQELTIEGGTISISSVYSQGLLKTLTQALQSSGVDLSQASISVQIELGKRKHFMPTVPTSIFKDNEVPSSFQGATHSRVAADENSDQALKKLKTGRI